ncbi:MAG: cyclic dehypoxanthinyl futalosine synthase [Coriobacteriia bacterium]|nr:cyclic dehypoxanthinyl futalosine synthase [Coriobacteriia bacterium]
MTDRAERSSAEVGGEFRSEGANAPERGLSEPPTSSPALHDLAFAAARGEHRLTAAEALALLEHADILHLGAAATAMRDRLHPEREVTFIVDRNVNYTNVCVSGCRFCAFYRDASDDDAYVMQPDELYAKVEETLALEGTAILLQGGLHPDLGIEWYEDMLRALKERYPIHVHGFGPPEMVHIARVSGISTREVLQRLRDAGLNSLPGGGAEILVDSVRSHVSPKKATSDEWLDVMREAHELGMSTTATMMFGGTETIEDRVAHMQRVREVQDEAAAKDAVGFRAFIPWSFQPGNTELAEGEFTGEAASGWEYLRTLAVSRLFLDNIANIQASWVTQGPKIGQVALCFGANDMGSTMIEENVVASAGTRFMLAREELVRLIRDAGFTPVQRDTLYREVRRF